MSKSKYSEILIEANESRERLEATVTSFLKLIHNQSDKIEELNHAKEQELDSIFKDIISVIDAFDKADSRLMEQFPDNVDVEKARKRFATSKKKLWEILNKNGIKEIEFPEGKATLEDCQISDVEPDSSKENDTIIAIEKPGYRRNGRLLRLAEVVIVRNNS